MLLVCEQRLNPGQRLYSVKWYKEQMEFWRHEPRSRPQTIKFPVAGVDLAVRTIANTAQRLTPTTARTRTATKQDTPAPEERDAGIKRDVQLRGDAGQLRDWSPRRSPQRET